jgi:hypothetical protein
MQICGAHVNRNGAAFTGKTCLMTQHDIHSHLLKDP